MFNLFGGKPQVKVEAIATDGTTKCFSQDLLPPDESDLSLAVKTLKELNKDERKSYIYSSVKIIYPR